MWNFWGMVETEELEKFQADVSRTRKGQPQGPALLLLG